MAAKGSEPGCQAPRRGHVKNALGLSERLACRAVGLARSTYRTLPMAQTPADPDAELRAWLRNDATKNPCHGFRRAWAVLRYDEGREVNKKKIHRLWREEGLQVTFTSRASGPGCPRSRRFRRCAEGGVGNGFPGRRPH